MDTLHKHLKQLYEGSTPTSARFRFGLLAFDIVTIGYFIVTSMLHINLWILLIDYMIAVFLIVDFAIRVWLSRQRKRYLMSLGTIIDVVVIITFLLPLIIDNLAFLRILRTLRLMRSYRVIKDLRKQFPFFAKNEDVIQSSVNLMVFIFFITAVVFVLQVHVNEDINDYVDALYFTVTTLTTTGFGDITLHGTSGHLLSVVIMVVGVGLFLRLVQTIFQPAKVRHTCPTCGLSKHDPDAVHCKHCGIVLNIETDGV